MDIFEVSISRSVCKYSRMKLIGLEPFMLLVISIYLLQSITIGKLQAHFNWFLTCQNVLSCLCRHVVFCKRKMCIYVVKLLYTRHIPDFCLSRGLSGLVQWTEYDVELLLNFFLDQVILLWKYNLFCCCRDFENCSISKVVQLRSFTASILSVQGITIPSVLF